MKPTADFLTQAQACIEKVVRGYRPKLLRAYGSIEHEVKDDDTIVTQLDKELEHLLRDALRAFDPGIGLQGEEHDNEGNPDTFWLIDPIDNTEAFSRGLPFPRNMISLIDKGEPVFGFVYKFVTDELFVARKGGGAYRNGERLQVSDRPINRTWVEVSARFSESEVLRVVGPLYAAVKSLRMIGDFTYVAEGKVDARLVYKSPGGPWDHAPMAVLVTEAGGRIANIGSQDYDYRNTDLLAASPLVFDDLMEVINTAVEAKP